VEMFIARGRYRARPQSSTFDPRTNTAVLARARGGSDARAYFFYAGGTVFSADGSGR
jgi:hypothetical protein